MKKQRLPIGWDEKKVRRVLQHYENQTEEEAAMEDGAAFEGNKVTIMKVPRALVPAIRQLIAKRHKSSAA